MTAEYWHSSICVESAWDLRPCPSKLFCAMERSLLESLLQQILQTKIDAGLPPDTGLMETLDHLLHCPDLELDDLTSCELPPYASQETMLQEHAVHGQTVPQPPVLGHLEPDTMQEDADWVYAPSSPVQPASSTNQDGQVGASTDAAPPQCPLCMHPFRRRQERDRHVETHMPYPFFCPFDRCPWRSGRGYDLKPHWLKSHADFGEAPQPKDCIIYMPRPLVQSVISGESTIEGAIEIALKAVRIRAQELHKDGLWEGEWGRRQRVPH